MNRNDFAVLTIPDQVNLVSTYLAQNKSMIDIFKREQLIESDESSVKKRFVKNGYKHNKEKTERLLKLVGQQPEVDELLKWWKNEKNIVDDPVIILYKEEFNGEVIAKTFKTYKNMGTSINKFLEFFNAHK